MFQNQQIVKDIKYCGPSVLKVNFFYNSDYTPSWMRTAKFGG